MKYNANIRFTNFNDADQTAVFETLTDQNYSLMPASAYLALLELLDDNQRAAFRDIMLASTGGHYITITR